MNKNNQSGSAHAVIIISLVLVLITALGWIFWQNFIYKVPVDVTNVTTNENQANATKTYKSSEYGLSLDYLADWSVTEKKYAQGELSSLDVQIKDDKDQEVAKLTTNLSGLGGAGPPHEYHVLHVNKIDIPTKTQSYVVFIASGAKESDSSSYSVSYGISSDFTKIMHNQVAQGGLLYLTTEFKDKTIGSTWFTGKTPEDKQFKNLKEVEEYYLSDEYQEIQSMLLSLKST